MREFIETVNEYPWTFALLFFAACIIIDKIRGNE